MHPTNACARNAGRHGIRAWKVGKRGTCVGRRVNSERGTVSDLQALVLAGIRAAGQLGVAPRSPGVSVVFQGNTGVPPKGGRHHEVSAQKTTYISIDNALAQKNTQRAITAYMHGRLASDVNFDLQALVPADIGAAGQLRVAPRSPGVSVVFQGNTGAPPKSRAPPQSQRATKRHACQTKLIRKKRVKCGVISIQLRARPPTTGPRPTRGGVPVPRVSKETPGPHQGMDAAPRPTRAHTTPARRTYSHSAGRPAFSRCAYSTGFPCSPRQCYSARYCRAYIRF